MTMHLALIALPGIPEVHCGDELGNLIESALNAAGQKLQTGDVIVIAHKIVSKAEGRIKKLDEVTPSDAARKLADEINKDPRKVELVLQDSVRIVRSQFRPDPAGGLLITEHRLGFICANAGVDDSNSGDDGTVICLPEDPDRSARQIRNYLNRKFDTEIGVIITDTFGRPWRDGQVNVAIGLAGLPAFTELAGSKDRDGMTLQISKPATADEIAAACGLVSGKADGNPVTLVRGLKWSPSNDTARTLLRQEKEDLFR